MCKRKGPACNKASKADHLMEPIVERLQQLQQELPQEVRLIAVSKTHPPETVLKAYEAGHRDFGENKVQELCSKAEALPEDIRWHLIGHLQRNKVKHIAPFVNLIHSVDSLRLLNEINKRAAQNDRVIDCLVQVKLTDEETKFGFTFEQARTILHPDRTKEEFDNIRLCGLMGMATHTDNEEQIRNEFRRIRNLFDEMKTTHCRNRPYFKELSIGMTHDYPLAIQEGTTMVRIGSAIFGKRNYAQHA